MSEIHQLIMKLEAKIDALEQEESRLQDHLEELTQVKQICLEYEAKAKIIEMDQPGRGSAVSPA